MDQIEKTDKLHYSKISDHYVSGNLKMQAINLPTFLQHNTLPTLANSVPAIESPKRSSFKAPILTRINRILQVALIVLSAIAVAAYSIDVMMSRTLIINQEKARRLGEQNCELSARLLKSISFQDIQESVLGHGTRRSSLHVPEEVLVAAEVKPVKYKSFSPSKHHLPLIAGY